MYKNFVITESEKKRIKNLYGLISEQNVINKEKREGVFYSKKRGRYERKKD